ncbi:methyltransferase domain-containing protein [Patescibacteria group bacterium]|nr:methyltransferase domain-containing protein [Patescibacteria group bacterium]
MSAGNALLNAWSVLKAVDISDGSIVADFGCGSSGHIVLPASRLVGSGGRVYAVELVPQVLEMLKNRCSHKGCTNTHHVWGDFERTNGVDIPSGSVDVVYFVNNAWQSNLGKALNEIKRVLTPCGKLVLVDWHKHIDHPIAPEKSLRMRGIEAHRILKDFGCTEVSRFEPSDIHWGLVCGFDE